MDGISKEMKAATQYLKTFRATLAKLKGCIQEVTPQPQPAYTLRHVQKQLQDQINPDIGW